MSKLEEWFFSEPGKTVMKVTDPAAEKVAAILGKGIIRGEHILRGGLPAKYSFNFDDIYSGQN